MKPIRLIKDWLEWKAGYVFCVDGIPSSDVRELLVRNKMAEYVKFIRDDDAYAN